ncbi:hypothetical protein ACM75Z_30530 [Pseudomonas aeruginosa]
MSPECVVPIAFHLATVVVLAVLAYRRGLATRGRKGAEAAADAERHGASPDEP